MRAVVLACLALVGCSARPGTLSVDLVTDLVPGVEIFVARTTAVSSRVDPGPSAEPQLFELDPNRDFTDEDVRIAEVRDLAPGEHRATIELLDAEGNVLVRRGVDVRIAGSLSIRVVITRDCIFLGCPGVTECV